MYSSLKIISGGQTGVDRAALDFAMEHGLEQGGWCPRGRRAEDGRIPDRYCLVETPESAYAARTERNVIDSDATVVFSAPGEIRGGTLLTVRLAREHEAPLLHLTADMPTSEAAARLNAFIREHRVRVLNVAGPRASQEPGIVAFVWDVLAQALI
jgi:hypothetical protein